MVKKRRQSDPHANESDSSSGDACLSNKAESKTNCKHIKKSVNVQRLRKIFKTSSIENVKCTECMKMPSGGDAALEASDYEYDRTLWMCLQCGTNLCGRSINKHALKHYETPRSDSHALAMNTTTMEIWCYDCDANVENNDHSIAQCTDLLKKASTKLSPLPANSSENIENGDAFLKNSDGAQINVDSMRSLLGNTISIVHSLSGNSSIPGQAKRVLSSQNAVDHLPRVRGLSNLGNTCFFNAVMQCLAQTPYLLSVLKELSQPNEEFSLPGGKFKLKPDEEDIELEPISGKLRSWGPLTATLAETLEELQQSGGVYNPRKVFQALTKIWPQFAGGDQHDSHELLRHLLESVKTEDLKRYQKVILSFLHYDEYRGKDLQAVPDIIKQKCKFYGQQASDRIMCPEQVFRGFLVSTLTCQDCRHTKSRHENFLDLSVPVCTEKPAPPIRRKSSPDEMYSNKESISKLKHQKQLEQRNKKNRSSSQEESDADVEDNLSEDISAKKSSIRKIDSNGNLEPEAKAEKQDDDPENVNKDGNDLNQLNNVFLELGISTGGSQQVLVQQISQEENDCSKQTQTQTSLTDSFQPMNLDDRKEARAKAKRKRLHSYTDWSTTIAPRYHCEDGECSIQSCLNNFTAAELMTGNNKVGCDSCSERINGKDGKTINTNATKQFLISSPPAVLILHLKRFQVGPRCMFRKMSKHVTFPFILDLAPFCASKVKTLPNVHRHQKKLIYSLYGVVEHSGSMHGGHYVAYVRVRPNLSKDDPRWKFLPKGSKVELDQTDEQKVRLDEALKMNQLRENRLKSGDSDDSTSSSSSDSKASSKFNCDQSSSFEKEPPPMPSPPPGKWYYVSDSHVQEATEERVLAAQAYLLFYERIY